MSTKNESQKTEVKVENKFVSAMKGLFVKLFVDVKRKEREKLITQLSEATGYKKLYFDCLTEAQLEVEAQKLKIK